MSCLPAILGSTLRYRKARLLGCTATSSGSSPRTGLALGGPQTKFPLLAGQNLPLPPSISILRFCDTASVLMAFLASLIIIIQSDPFEAAIPGYF